MDLQLASEEKRTTVLHAAVLWLSRSHRLPTMAVCLVTMWLAFRVISGPNGWMAYHSKKVEYQQLQREVQGLQKQNDEMDRRVKALTNSPEAIEKEAREQLHYVRPGEMVYVLPDQKTASPQAKQSGAQRQ